MLRLVGVAALAVGLGACAPAEDGTALDAAEPARIEAGVRLERIEYVFPDGTRVAAEELFDRELEVRCGLTDRTADGRTRCLPGNAAIERYADAGCQEPLGRAEPTSCTPRFYRDDRSAEVRVYRASDVAWTGPAHQRDVHGECVVADDSPGDWVRLTPVPEDHFAAGDASRRRTGAGWFDEVTTRFEDGTVTRARQPASGCALVQLDRDPEVRRCVPAEALVTSELLYAFLDPQCQTRMVAGALPGVETGSLIAHSRGWVHDNVHEVRTEPQPFPRRFYRPNGPYGSCLPVDRDWESDLVVRGLGPARSPDSFRAYRRVHVGEGRLRETRWVDERQLAVSARLLGFGTEPNGDTRDTWLDTELGIQCRPAQTAEGIRCLAAGALTIDDLVTSFYGFDCTVPAILPSGTHPSPLSHIGYASPVDPSSPWCARSAAIGAVRQLVGPTGQRILSDWVDGECEWRGGIGPALAESAEVPLTTFAEVTVEPDVSE